MARYSLFECFSFAHRLEYLPDRNLDRNQLLRLSTCTYIEEKHNLILLGATGAGKSYIVCALGVSACRNFYKVRYIRLPDLFNELAVAWGECVFSKAISAYKNVPLLILDEWLLVKLSNTEARDLLELVEARHQNCSTIYCSQFSPAGWAVRSVKIPLRKRTWIASSITHILS